MTWFRVDDGSDFHPKVVQAGNDAWGAVCRAGAWSSRQGTDGFVPDHIATLIAPKKVWLRAESAKGSGAFGLVERRDGGWQIHDFVQWNPSAKEVEQARVELSEKRRKAGLAGNAKRWDGHRKKVASANADGVANASQTDRTCDDHDLAPDPTRISSPTEMVRGVPPAPSPVETERPEPEPAPILTPDEPPKPKRARRPRQQSLAVKNYTSTGWRIWRDLYERSKRNYGRYVDSPEDGREMGRICQSAASHAIDELNHRGTPSEPAEPIVEAILDHWFKSFLRDDGGDKEFLVERRHPLRFVLKGVTAYGTPWSKTNSTAPGSMSAGLASRQAVIAHVGGGIQ